MAELQGLFDAIDSLEAKLKVLEEKTEFLNNQLHGIIKNDGSYCGHSLVIEALDKGRTDMVKILIESGCKVYKASKSNQERTVLQAAIQLGDQDLIRTLLAKGASPDILYYDAQNKTPFHLAIDNNQLATIELFLSQFDAKTFDEKYLLHYAVEEDDIQVVSKLIAKGLSLTKKNEEGLTPFCVASNNENSQMLDYLLLQHKVKNIIPNDHDDIPPAYIAIICGNLKAIKKYVDSGLLIDIPLNLNTHTWLCLNNWLSESGFTLLHFAVKLVKLKIVKYLLSKGADILAKDTNGLSPLHIAFENKEKGIWKTWQDFDDNNSIIDMILQANTKSNSNPINKHGLSHFHIACSRDEPTVVEHFLKLGASINQPVKLECYLYKKFSPLHFAAKFRCKKTMQVLLKNGADVKQKDFMKMTALHVAAKESCLDTVSLLLQYGADISTKDFQRKTPIHWAFEKKNYRTIDLLLSVRNVAKSNPTNSQSLSHFHIACTRNNVDVVKSFIENGVSLDKCVPAQSDEDNDSVVADWSGYSPLHFAVSHNRAKTLQLLLESGANVGMKDNKGVTPFHLACQYTHEMFGELIENNLCDFSKHRKMTKQLHSLTDVERVDEKYAKFSVILSADKSRYGQKIDWSASRKDYLKIMSLLLDYGSDVNCIDNNGNAPVFYAHAAVNKVESILKNNLNCSEALWARITEFLSEELRERRKLIVSDLLKLDVNLDNCYKNGSILHYIVCNHKEDKQSDEMMKLFLKHGANVNATDENMLTPLHQAALKDSKSLASILLDYNANVDCIDPKDNSTPLLTATSQFKPAIPYDNIIETLLDKGANPNARQSNGRTALHNLASRPHSKMGHFFSYLIQAGANVNSQDSKGLSALHVACKVENDETLKILLRHGADVNVEDNKGRSICCYLFEKHVSFLDEDEVPDVVAEMMKALQVHIIRMNVIDLPVSKKAFSSYCQFDDFQPLSDEEITELVEKCQSEVQLLRDTQIHGRCTLLDAIFKSENSLSHLVKTRTFRKMYVAQCVLSKKTYPQYGYLIQLTYQTGAHRGKLLPMAKILFDRLAGMRLPDTCSENICSYFNNAELKESVEILRGILDSTVEKTDEIQSTGFRTGKRQKVN